MNELTMKLKCGGDLTRDEVAAAVEALLDESVAEETKASFLTALAQKGETAEEIAAFAVELRARAVNPQLSGDLLDVVGTGADRSHTFNISTCVVFVAAAAGVRVAKHGNRAVTSRCGSADVLAALGARIELQPEAARRCLEETGLTFLFAPLYHPAFRKIAPVRRKLAELGQRTVFNILGPLVNPACPTHQVIGVFDRGLGEKYAEVLKALGLKRAMVVHGNGLDEFSTLGANYVAELHAGQVVIYEKIFPRDPSENLARNPTLSDLEGGDAAENARIVRAVLGGTDRGPKRDIVLLNAAAALVTAGKVPDFSGGRALVAELIDSGAALAKLTEFVESTKKS
ncbi:MAG: anthranilate phosphoribosyltransferase [Verrucomicrobiae bacterium]|nr:anthranilate phosphoribosyltransferase [Verrucomicrobiae bacterium]